ncbi:MAG: hypothetical protein PUP93_30490 [Rhizonema sp. NSF051]|nr:hypothetical protein [Rhizonema sp. NSF051]
MRKLKAPNQSCDRLQQLITQSTEVVNKPAVPMPIQPPQYYEVPNA